MTDMIEQWEDISTGINQLYNRLYNLLEKYHADIDPNMTFEELCWAVENIPGKIYPQDTNKRPFRDITYNPNGSIIHKDIYVYKKIRYFKEILSYALIYKGVNRYSVRSKTKLSELIELVNEIEKLHDSRLSIISYDEVFYYNTYTYIDYNLVDENNNPIEEGYVVVKHNGVVVSRVHTGHQLSILPKPVSDAETYEIYYEGTDGYTESNHVSIVVPIKPPQILLEISTINNSLTNRYDGVTSDDTFFDTDDVEISVKAVNGLSGRAPMGEVPITIRLPDVNGKYHTICRGITDNDGYVRCNTNFTVHNSELEHIYIFAESNITDEVLASNNSAYKEVFVKWSPLYVPDCKFYSEETNKNIKISYRNIDTGQPTTEYVSQRVRITKTNNEYDDIFPAGNTTFSNYNCTEREIGQYRYTYTLYKNNQIYYQTHNNIKINPLVNINLYIPDKLLKTTTDTLECIVEILDYQNNPTTLPDGVYLCITHGWSCTNYPQTYANDSSLTTIALPIDEILNDCNGFFIQAISVNDKDTYSNIVYVRNHLSNELSNQLSVNASQNDYTLGDLSFDVYGTLIDEEENPVNRTFTMNVKINNVTKKTYTITPNYRGEYNKNIAIEEAWLGDDINIVCTFNGDRNYYSASNNNMTVIYTKADINYWNTDYTGIVYQYCSNYHTIGLTEGSIYNKYINGTITYNGIEININNNHFTTRILPMQAGTYQLTLFYSGNKYYNAKTHTVDITIDKTTDYIFDVDYDEEVPYGTSITFTPSLTDGEDSDAEHTYTGTLQYTFNNPTLIINTNITPYTYTPTNTGNHTVTIVYSGDSNHESRVITKSFTVTKITPSLSLIVPEIDAMYRNDIDYKASKIGYTGNDEGLTVRVYDNNVEKYNQSNKEHDEEIFNITSAGQHTIKLKTDETNIYNSLTIEKNIETYDFLEETYKMMNETNYVDGYSIEEKIEQILDCILNNASNYDEDTLEGLYKILEHLED